jgi:two-component system chemotaxis response regulator CheY
MLALIVDDSRLARSVLKRSLSERGFLTIEAEDGRSGLALLSTIDPPDVVLVDWNMPNMNGLDFVRSVRQDARYEAMLLVMVTSEADPRQMVRAMNAGANEYLMKPYTKELLFSKLELLGLGSPV